MVPSFKKKTTLSYESNKHVRKTYKKENSLVTNAAQEDQKSNVLFAYSCTRLERKSLFGIEGTPNLFPVRAYYTILKHETEHGTAALVDKLSFVCRKLKGTLLHCVTLLR